MTMEALARSMQRALESQGIGTPVAARLVAYTTPDPDLIERQLAEALALVSRWLDGVPQRIRTEGGLLAGKITLLAQFDKGQSALIS